MGKRALVLLAPGFEDLEAVTIIDLLRRAEIEVVTAGLHDGPVTGSRKTVVAPDTTLDAAAKAKWEFDMVALPGGMPGSDNLAEDARVIGLLREMAAAGKFTCAICAAPKVLAKAGLLDGKRATCSPGVMENEGVTAEPVVRDGAVITSRSVGTAMDFALELIEALEGKQKREQVEKSLVR